MDAKAQQELNSIKKELQSIINELRSIANGVRYDFTNIGNRNCADSIVRVARQYEYVKKKLDNIDCFAITDKFAAKHSNGGGGQRF